MLIRIVRMTFEPEHVDDFLEIFHSSEEKIRNMPGCRYLELLQDVEQPNAFTTYSKWDSEDDLNNYRKSETFGQVWPKTKALFAEPARAFSSNKVN